MFFVDLCVAFAIACLSGMGIGGGGLLVIWLILVRNVPPHTAQGLNLGFFIVSALFAYTHHRKKRRLPLPYLFAILFCALGGVLLGCSLTARNDPVYAKAAFGWFLILCGIINLARILLRSVKKRRTVSLPKQM